ncbi:protein of unknown function (plasmid) [Caballeronia sp. S22]
MRPFFPCIDDACPAHRSRPVIQAYDLNFVRFMARTQPRGDRWYCSSFTCRSFPATALRYSVRFPSAVMGLHTDPSTHLDGSAQSRLIALSPYRLSGFFDAT